MSKLEEELASHIFLLALPVPVREYRFIANHIGLGPRIRERIAEAKLKDWRFDFAWPDLMIAVEVEGGGWTGGRHTRVKGFEDDLRKYDKAMGLGCTVYRCSGSMVKEGVAVRSIEKLLQLTQETKT